MKFNEHGQFQLETSGNVIYYRVLGCWNIEASKSCLDLIRKCFEEVKGKPIIMVVDSTDFEGGIEEAYPLWSAEMSFWLTSGMTHFIRIDDSKSVRYNLFIERMDKAIQAVVKFNFANDFDDAIKQSKAYGFIGF